MACAEALTVHRTPCPATWQRALFSGIFLDDLELEVQFLAAKDVTQVKLPELACESKRRPTLIQIRDELKPDGAPQIRQTHVDANRFQLDICVEGKEAAILHEAIKRVAVEVIAMSRVRGPVGVGVVRRDEFDSSARSGDAMKLRDEGHHIRHMLGHMATDDFVKLIIIERIRDDAEVVYHIRIGARVEIHADCARMLVASAANI
jgi:hypothetical protein